MLKLSDFIGSSTDIANKNITKYHNWTLKGLILIDYWSQRTFYLCNKLKRLCYFDKIFIIPFSSFYFKDAIGFLKQ